MTERNKLLSLAIGSWTLSLVFGILAAYFGDYTTLESFRVLFTIKSFVSGCVTLVCTMGYFGIWRSY